MAWHSQQNDRPPESAHAVAWTALFFSLLACGMAGIALMRGQDARQMGKKIKENIKHVGNEASKLLKKSDGEKTAAEEKKISNGALKEPAAGAAKEATPGATQGAEEAVLDKEKIREKVDDLRTMVDKGDDRATQYLESLKSELGAIRDYTAEKGGPTLQKTLDRLREVGEKLKEDSAVAGKKLKELSDDLKPRVQSLIGGEDESKDATPTPDSSGRGSAR